MNTQPPGAVLTSPSTTAQAAATIRYNEYVTDMGLNISIPCTTTDDPATTMWLKEGHNQTRQFHAGGVLRLYRLQRSDAAVYVCLVAASSKHGQQLLAAAADTSTEVAEPPGTNGTSNVSSSNSSNHYQPAVYENTDGTFVEALRVRVIVRSVPCAVTRLSMRISTILGVLIWEYNRTTAYAHPLKSFTAEYRLHNATQPLPWDRLDPKNISPNIVSVWTVGFGGANWLHIQSNRLIVANTNSGTWKSITCCPTQRMNFASGATIMSDRAKLPPPL